MVAHSIDIMSELPLILNEESWDSRRQDLEDFKRKYHTIVVDGCPCWAISDALKVFHKFGPELRRLEIEDSCIEDEANMWNQILETCGCLEFLKITNVIFFEYDPDIPQNLHPKNLHHLQTVVLDNGSQKVSENNY